MKTPAGLLLLGLSVSACAAQRVYVPGETYSRAEVEEVNRRRTEALLGRAAFDTRCTAAEVRFTCLQADVDGFCITAGIEGCQQRATYVWAHTGQFQAQWVLDATNGGAKRDRSP